MGLTSHSTHYRSFGDDFYRPDDSEMLIKDKAEIARLIYNLQDLHRSMLSPLTSPAMGTTARAPTHPTVFFQLTSELRKVYNS